MKTASFWVFQALAVLGFLASGPRSFGATELYNAQALRDQFGLSAYIGEPGLAKIKIAILDNGFAGFDPKSGTLPTNAELIEKYDGAPLGDSLEPTAHGLYLAEAIWSLTGKAPDGPKFYLLNTAGMTNLRNAVDFSIHHSVDVILYSQNWEYGGNFDGRGFINQVVNEATSHGIIWVNAAGNYHNQVYNGPIPDSNRCFRFKNRFDSNEVMMVLSWNDFQDTENYQTKKDLDFFVTDSQGHVVAQSDLAQMKLPHDTRTPSLHAREITEALLNRGDFCLKIKNISQNFTSSDRIRLTIFSEDKPGDSIDFIDHTSGNEIMVPADNPTVITVGDTSPESAVGPTMDGRTKPDVVLPSVPATFTDGFISSGTSNSAAYVAAIAVAMKGRDASVNRAEVISYIDSVVANGNDNDPDGISLIDPAVVSELERLGGISRADIVKVTVETGRKVLWLRKNPIDLGNLYGNLRNSCGLAGLDPESAACSDAFEYFIAPNPASAPGAPQVATYYLSKEYAGPLPPILLQTDASGTFVWVELRQADSEP